MLAHRYDKYSDKINFPCAAQPKLDGHRCIAVVKEGKCELFSRQRKPITGVPHIIKAIEELVETDTILDGELYSHDYKDGFEELTGFIRSKDPKEGHEVVQYHVYDIVNTDMSFELRNEHLEDIINTLDSHLQLVPTVLVSDEDAALTEFRHFRNEGYEGLMLRNLDSLYVGKRSYDLQKVKEFDDAEFEIVGVKEGKGKMKGHAIFECVTETSERFDVKMKGSMDKLKEIWENKDSYIGKTLTVMFQERTKNEIPRFPVGLRLREGE
jgi:DNA ligase-1